jgi:DNA-binding response OmpR family regulator
MWQDTIRKELDSVRPDQRMAYMERYLEYLMPSVEPAASLWEIGLRFTKTEGRYIYVLSTPMGKIVSLDAMINQVYDSASVDVDLRSVSTVIKRIRPRLRKVGLEIVTHYNLGYSMKNEGSLVLPWTAAGETRLVAQAA